MSITDTPASVLERVSLPISQATGLPNTHYTSDEAFYHDRDKVIAQSWACIGFVDELEDSNAVRPIDFMGLPLLLTKDEHKQLRVFHNVCSHRGMKLVDSPCRNNGAIRCPYHSWTYANDGTLRATPNIGGHGVHSHDDFDKTANGLEEIASATWLGAIFINLAGNCVAFEDYIAPVVKQWSRFLDPGLLTNFVLSDNESQLQLTVKSNWKLAVENYLESYHLPSVHPELNRVSPLDAHYYLETFKNGAGQGSKNYRRLEVDGSSLPSVKDWPGKLANFAEYPVIYPNTFLGIHADQLFIQYLQPLSTNETAEHVRVFYYTEEACSSSFQQHRSETLAGWKNVFEEDIFAVERMQAGRHSPAYKGGAFSPVMDHPTLHFHQWVAQMLAS